MFQKQLSIYFYVVKEKLMLYTAGYNLHRVSWKEAKSHFCLFYFPFDWGDLVGSENIYPPSVLDETSLFKNAAKPMKREGVSVAD